MNSTPPSGIDEARREESDAFGLLHDRVHHDPGGSRPAKTARREQSRAERIEAAARRVIREARLLDADICGDFACRGEPRPCRELRKPPNEWCYGCDLAQSIDDLAAALEGE